MTDEGFALEPLEDETRDEVCGVRVLQRKAGYRVNLDSILLAIKRVGSVYDATRVLPGART